MSKNTSGGTPQSSAQEREGEIQRANTPAVETAPAPEPVKAVEEKRDPYIAPAPGTDASVDNTVSVQVTGNFMLMDPYTFVEILPDEDPKAVPRTAFIDQQLKLGQLVEA